MIIYVIAWFAWAAQAQTQIHVINARKRYKRKPKCPKMLTQYGFVSFTWVCAPFAFSISELTIGAQSMIMSPIFISLVISINTPVVESTVITNWNCASVVSIIWNGTSISSYLTLIFKWNGEPSGNAPLVSGWRRSHPQLVSTIF